MAHIYICIYICIYIYIYTVKLFWSPNLLGGGNILSPKSSQNQKTSPDLSQIMPSSSRKLPQMKPKSSPNHPPIIPTASPNTLKIIPKSCPDHPPGYDPLQISLNRPVYGGGGGMRVSERADASERASERATTYEPMLLRHGQLQLYSFIRFSVNMRSKACRHGGIETQNVQNKWIFWRRNEGSRILSKKNS